MGWENNVLAGRCLWQYLAQTMKEVRIKMADWSQLNEFLDTQEEFPCSETKELFSVRSDLVGALNLPTRKPPATVPEKLWEKVSESLREQFQKHGIKLSPTAEAEWRVTWIQSHMIKTKWRIVDANKTYLIILSDEYQMLEVIEDPKLRVYAQGKPKYKNQCAIRMGVLVGIDIGVPDSFQGATCGLPNHDLLDEPPAGHILRARELANWLRAQTREVPKVKIYKKATLKDFEGRRGIMFIQKPTGGEGLDHIDLWDGQRLKQKDAKTSKSWIEACDQVWFWDLWPHIVKSASGDVDVIAPDFNNLLPSIKTNSPVQVIGYENKDGVRLGKVKMAKSFDEMAKDFDEMAEKKKSGGEPTKVEYYKYGFIESNFIVPPESPAAITTGVVTARSLHIRKDHNNSSAEVGGLREGEKVTIKEIWSDGKDTWAKLDTDRWAAIEINRKTLIEGVEKAFYETLIEGVF